METKTESIFSKEISPFKQLTMIGGILLAAILLAAVAGAADTPFGPEYPYILSTAFMMCFAIFNSMFSLSTNNLNRYWTNSMLCYIILMVGSALVSYLVSGISPMETGYKLVYMALTIGYVVFMGIAGVMKRLMGFFDREQERKLAGKDRRRRRKRRKN